MIRNRAEDPKKRWPRTVSGVILEPRQFSSFNAGDPNAVKFPVEPAISATMAKIIKEFGLNSAAAGADMRRAIGVTRQEVKRELFTTVNKLPNGLREWERTRK